MRILWISPNGGNYKNYSVKGSGGWIGALQKDLSNSYPNLELGIAFESSDSEFTKEGNVSYFPICSKKERTIGRLKGMLFNESKKRELLLIESVSKIIEEYKPDAVHVWGTENTYASVIPYLNVPFVVHIQGFLSLILYSYLPPSFSLVDINRVDSWWYPMTWIKRILHFSQKDIYSDFSYRARRELNVAQYVKHWIGRTDWDFHASQMLSPNSNYYYCEEIMRGDFNEVKWKYHHDNKAIRVHTTISETWYKGIDVVLQTANVLKTQGVNIEWKVYGVERNRRLVNYITKRLSIKPEEVNVHFMGSVPGKVIRDSLLSCDVFVHPSYIENSSNAIAEAMMLGVPTIAQYVGGNPTMLREDSGILVPANAPYDLAYAIKQACDKDIMEGYSERAYKVARVRQDKYKTIGNLVSIYKTIVERG